MIHLLEKQNDKIKSCFLKNVCLVKMAIYELFYPVLVCWSCRVIQITSVAQKAAVYVGVKASLVCVKCCIRRKTISENTIFDQMLNVKASDLRHVRRTDHGVTSSSLSSKQTHTVSASDSIPDPEHY